jgi:hypothetical protein
MKKLFVLLTLLVLAFAPSVARSAMSPSTVGVGPHGYDFLIGTWSCKNSMPSPMGGPAATTLTVSRTAMGALSVHVTGANFDGLGYVVYTAKTKTWWNPSALATGGYSTESTQQTGKKTVWTGPFNDVATGKTITIRDTYTMDSPTTYKDLSEAQIGGTWKTEGNTTCTKM